MKTLSVIIPAYNEGATIGQLLERVRVQSLVDFRLEVIVVDDGSTDDTSQVLQDNPVLYDRLITLPTNQGKGGAVIAGLRVASGEFVLFQDADLEYDPAEYKDLLLPVAKFDSDVVIGSRFMGPRYSRIHYFWHKLGNHLITGLFNILNNTTFSDVYSCYLLYRRNLVDPESLKSHGWEQQAEILSQAVKQAKVMYEVPISYHGRSYDEGKKIKAYHVIAVILMIIRKRFVG